MFTRGLDCAKLCKESYSNNEQIIRGNTTDVEYVTLENVETRELTFVFRGTDSISDVCIDLKFIKERFHETHAKNIKVHRGFLAQFDDIKFKVMTKINTFEPVRITFTGHSLGGALATLFAVACKNYYPSMFVSCVTFGSPRVGNSSFARHFNSIIDESMRFVLGNDIVAQNPKILYEHVKGKIKIDVKNTSCCCLLASVEDHDIDNYIAYFSDHVKS